MLNIYVACNLWGETFSPKEVEREVEIAFERKNEPGDIASSGRYRDKPLPYGSATLVVREGGERGVLIPFESIRFLGKNLDRFKKAGATDIVLDVVVAYGGQCNLEMSAKLLNALASLHIPLTISCYEDASLRED
jgi:hypothetical protein